MLKNAIDVDAFACRFPDCRAKLAHLFEPRIVFRRVDLWQLTPAIELFAVDDALGAKLLHEVDLVVLGDDADGIGT